jgi:hypothetical protein
MRLSLLANFLWAASFAGQIALFAVLIAKKRWRTFPFFTSWITFDILDTILLYLVFRHGNPSLYTAVYWVCAVLDLLLEIAVIFEICRIVLKPTGTWVRDALHRFVLFSIIGVIVAIVLSLVASPKTPAGPESILEKGNLLASLLTLELLGAMTWSSTRLGLVWRHHVYGLVTGWALWAGVGVFVEAAYSYFGPNWHGIVLDQVRIVAYIAATFYWSIIFWLPEPEEHTLSAEMQSYLSGLHQRVHLTSQAVKAVGSPKR